MTSIWHQQSLQDIFQTLSVNDPDVGLSELEAQKRLQRHGLNQLPQEHKRIWWKLWLQQLKNPLVFILLIAAAVTLLVQEWMDAIVIVIVVVLNATIGFWQEFRSANILEHLQKLVVVTAIVIRSGQKLQRPADQLVPGDIVVVSAGMSVPADVRLMQTRDLTTNESVLTGESNPVVKKVAIVVAETSLADRSNMVYMGTAVEQGEGRGIVVATGIATELGQIAALTQAVTEETTPLQEKLSRLSRIITWIIGLCLFVIIILGIIEQRPWLETFILAVAVAVAAIPEGLPAALSVVLSVAGQKIYQTGGLIKNLAAAETLGSTNIICVDKTGTLTEGVMKATEILQATDTTIAWQIAALANEAVAEYRNQRFEIRGESTDKAKLEGFVQQGGNIMRLLEQEPRIVMLPFDAKRKYIASFHRLKNQSGSRLCVSGAPETILSICHDVSENDGTELKKTYEMKARQGFRVIALAQRIMPQQVTSDTSTEDLISHVRDVSFYGFLTLRDPMRAAVKDSIAVVRAAGIRVIMITGDHRLTAQAIGAELGFTINPHSVIEAVDIDQWSDPELLRRVAEIDIYARSEPKHKLRIVTAWRNHNKVVAMTGDGINDAPALKAADIGIALNSGTDVTKAAANLVLLNDSFVTIAEAVEQGRVAFDNIRKVSLLMMEGAFTELLLVLSALIFHIPLPVTAVQILWANLIEDGLPIFSLAFEPPEANVMRRSPIHRSENILTKQTLPFILGIGLVTDIVLVTVFVWLYRFTNMNIEHIRTIIFAALSTDSLVYIFALKSLRQPLYKIPLGNNRFLIGAAGIGLGITMLIIYLPQLNTLLETTPLSLGELGLVLGLVLFNVVLIELAKYIMNFFGTTGRFRLSH